MRAVVGFVLGKPPARSPVLGALVDHLRDGGDRVLVHVPSRDGGAPPWLAAADVVAIRGLSEPALTALIDAERAGTRFCDPPRAVLAARSRDAVHDRLAAAGLRTPRYGLATRWDEARRVADDADAEQVAVKHRGGEVGRGTRVLVGPASDLPEDPPFPGPYVVEDAVVPDGDEIKLYRIGDHLAAFTLAADGSARPRRTEDLVDVADVAAAALGLSVLGIDLLPGRDGPTIVDVNAFPSCKRLPDADLRLAAHLRSFARGTTPNVPDPRGIAP